MMITTSDLSRILTHYEGEKKMVFKRKMTNDYQELELIEIIDEIGTINLVMVFEKQE